MPMRVDIVTIEREVFSADDVDLLNAPGADGVLGILPRHAPVVSSLKEGELEIVRGEERELMAIGGGFLQVRDSHIIVMADAAERASEIDESRAEAARERAAQAVQGAGDDIDRERAMASLRRAEVRLSVAKRRRRG
jgi:F-type H+-transporting ATPase subunit epsilon